MIEILDTEDIVDRGGKAHVNLDFYLKKQITQTKNAIAYYSDKSVYVNSGHILHRILFAIDDGDMSPMQAFNKTKENLNELCLVMGITTHLNKGDINFKDFPYKYGTSIMSVESHDLADLITSDWKSITPLRMVYKSYSSNYLELPHPDSTEIDTSCGLTIDVSALAVKYYKWAKLNNDKPDDQQETRSDFIVRYLLSPLIMDSARLSYINMLTEFEEPKVKHKVPFVVVDQTKGIFKELSKIRESFTKEGKHHSNMMSEIPCFDKENFYDALTHLDRERITVANRWFKFLSDAQYVTAILNVTRNDPDKDILIRFRSVTRLMKGNGTLRSSPSSELNKYMSSQYDLIETLIPKK